LDPTLPPQLIRTWRKERDFDDFDYEDYRAETKTDDDL
jgi:hypothetical protein